jgi:hypothetical protein
MTDINALIREAREALGDDYDRDTLVAYAVPRLDASDLDVLVAEALWSRSLGISSAGRYAATRAAAMGNEPEDFEFGNAPEPFGRNLPKPARRRGRGEARAETASLVRRIVTRWLDSYQALGSISGEKRLGEYTAAEFREMAAAKRRLSETYSQQATSDDKISALMDRMQCTTADELPREALYLIVKNYRPIAGGQATDGTNTAETDTTEGAA